MNQNFVDTMLDKTARLTAGRFVAEGSAHYGEYGLDQPSNEILVTGTAGTRTIYLGSTNSATGDCYMAVDGSEKIYTVDATFANLFSSSLNTMATRETLPGISLDNMVVVTVKKEGSTFAFSRPSQGESQGEGGWSVSENDGPARAADSGLVSECLGKLVKLRYEEMTVYHPTQAQKKEYGLAGNEGESGSLIRVVYRDDAGQDGSGDSGQDISGQGGSGQDGSGDTMGEFVLHMGRDSKDGLYTYVYPEGGQGIYAVKKDGLEPFLHLSSENFLSLSVAPVKAETLAGLILTWENGRAEFRISPAGDEGREEQPEEQNGGQENGQKKVYTLNGHEITEAEFNKFYYPLYGFAAEKRVSDMASQLISQPILTMEYQCVPGTAQDMTVDLIPYDQNYYGARVNGQAFLLVNRQRVNSLMNEVNKLPLE
ncbi:DUF4340 domain-containing protein [Enterocloster citroniae]|uniref:DUF4340 domain-containing protein n=1 Tax=Enterocloster citroniae TaxID=358743 RepID=UPI00349ED66B